jgi:hypothetical protein
VFHDSSVPENGGFVKYILALDCHCGARRWEGHRTDPNATDLGCLGRQPIAFCGGVY